MPPRFVEVLDVHAEAHTLFNSVAVKATGLASNLKFNVSDYINATAGVFDARIVSALEQYGVGKDDIFEAMNSLNLQMSNTTFAQIERPRPLPAYLMAVGSIFLVAHLVLVHVQSRRLVSEFGHHNG